MTGTPPPRVVASLPGRSARECREQVRLAREAGAEIAEVRLDRWPAGQLAELPSLFPSPIDLMATYRSRREGGEGLDGSVGREAVYREIAQLPFRYVDLETERDATRPVREGTLPVRSRHWSAPVEAAELRRAVAVLGEPSGLAKLVLPASIAQALEAPLESCRDRRDHRLVVHTTGPSGPLLRAAAWRLALPMVYGRLPGARDDETTEASQIPIDRLRFYLDGPSPGPLFAVIGHPIARSDSPGIHSRWMRAMGDHGLYVALDAADPRELRAAISRLPSEGFLGLNVTSPWKRLALELADRSTDDAREAGAANVLTRGSRGGVEAANTDVAALRRRLGELARRADPQPEELLVVGTGGAARAAVLAGLSVDLGVLVLGRSREGSASLAKEFGIEEAGRSSPRSIGLVVHATPVGASATDHLAVALDAWLGPSSHLVDLVYSNPRSPLRRLAGRRGSAYEDGRRVLVYQASESYVRWWGHPVPPPLVESAVAGPS